MPGPKLHGRQCQGQGVSAPPGWLQSVCKVQLWDAELEAAVGHLGIAVRWAVGQTKVRGSDEGSESIAQTYKQ